MKLFSLLILFLTLSIANSKNFIINGRQALLGQFPSAVKLDINQIIGNIGYLEFCTGTLIAPSIVLTAAHCLIDKEFIKINLNEKNKIKVQMGSISPPYSTTILAKNLIIHENFQGVNNDIGLIELESPAPLSETIKPATLPTSMPIANSLVNAVGWGVTENGTESNEERYVTMPIISLEECAPSLEGTDDKNSYVCLLSPLSKGTCSGDSGGPFYLKDTNIVIGITDFGDKYLDDGLCLTDKPSVGTNVYFFLDWIHQHAKI